MKKKLIRLTLISTLSLSPLTALCQSDIGDLFQSGPADAEKLVKAYFNPLFKGLGLGLNSGWTHTASSKRFLGIDIQLSGTMAMVPKSDRAFDVSTLGLENIRPSDPNKRVSPTAFGANKTGPEMEIYNPMVPDPNPATFNLPAGTGINFVPAPQVQLTVGLPKNIDVSLRFVPDVKVQDGSLNLFGIGAKLEVIPFLLGKKFKSAPVDLAIAFGYTSINFHLPLDLQNQSTHDQVVDVKLYGYNTEAILSKKISFFVPFVSAGINRSFSNLKAAGSYDFQVPVSPITPTGKKTYTDPVSFSQKDIDAFKATAGFQLNFGFFKLFSAYTLTGYNYFNAGVIFGTSK